MNFRWLPLRFFFSRFSLPLLIFWCFSTRLRLGFPKVEPLPALGRRMFPWGWWSAKVCLHGPSRVCGWRSWTSLGLWERGNSSNSLSYLHENVCWKGDWFHYRLFNWLFFWFASASMISKVRHPPIKQQYDSISLFGYSFESRVFAIAIAAPKYITPLVFLLDISKKNLKHGILRQPTCTSNLGRPRAHVKAAPTQSDLAFSTS